MNDQVNVTSREDKPRKSLIIQAILEKLQATILAPISKTQEEITKMAGNFEKGLLPKIQANPHLQLKNPNYAPNILKAITFSDPTPSIKQLFHHLFTELGEERIFLNEAQSALWREIQNEPMYLWLLEEKFTDRKQFVSHIIPTPYKRLAPPDTYGNRIVSTHDNLYGVINQQGKEIIPLGPYEILFESQGYTWVYKSCEHGTGKEITSYDRNGVESKDLPF